MNVDDRDRMLRMRAVPEDFDNVRALHSPYGAVHGLNADLSASSAAMASMYDPRAQKPSTPRAVQNNFVGALHLLAPPHSQPYASPAPGQMIGHRPAELDYSSNAGRNTPSNFQYGSSSGLPRAWDQPNAPLSDYHRTYPSRMSNPQGSQQQHFASPEPVPHIRDMASKPSHDQTQTHNRGYPALSDSIMRSSMQPSAPSPIGRMGPSASSLGGYRRPDHEEGTF